MTRIIALTAALIFISACQAPADVAPTEEFTAPGVDFSIEAIAQPNCDPAAGYTVRIRWDVKDIDDPNFEIRIGTPKGQLPARVHDAAGKFDTDPWARPGTWFLLINGDTEQILASKQAPPLSCL